MSVLNKERRLAIARVALAAAVAIGSPIAIVSDSSPNVKKEQQYLIDLGLQINERGFLETVNRGPRWGLLPEAVQKDKLSCPNWAPDVCMGKYSSNFRVAVNGPMADFMFKQSQLSNPIRPVKIIFVEDWLEINDKEHVSGSTGITADGKEIHIVISLKAAAWEAFQVMERQNFGTDYFEGAISFFISRSISHEIAHAGAEAKKLAKPDKLVPDQGEEDATHPQVYAFDARYQELQAKSASRGNAAGALIFGAQPRDGLDLAAYRELLRKEAKLRGME